MLRVASELTDVSIFALNLVTGLGLGLAIDYSLFIVSRYREEIAAHGPGLDAMRRTLATAGRTVLFSSLTVAGALASLLVFPQRFLYSMGIGGAIVALIAAAIALIVLPARARAARRAGQLARAELPAPRAERDARPAHERLLVPAVAARDAPSRAGSRRQRALLIVLGLPFLGSSSPRVDAQVLPDDASARQVDDVLRADFPPYRDTPITLAVDGARDAASGRRDAPARKLPGVAAVGPPQPAGRRHYAIDVRLVDAAAQAASQRAGARPARPRRARRCVTGVDGRFLDLQYEPGRAPPARAGDRRRHDARRAVPDDRLGGPADQAAPDEPARR